VRYVSAIRSSLVTAPDGKAAVAAGLGLVSMICLAAVSAAILTLSTRRYARIVHAWVESAGLNGSAYRTGHSLFGALQQRQTQRTSISKPGSPM
jgi:hypothetical protein